MKNIDKMYEEAREELSIMKYFNFIYEIIYEMYIFYNEMADKELGLDDCEYVEE